MLANTNVTVKGNETGEEILNLIKETVETSRINYEKEKNKRKPKMQLQSGFMFLTRNNKPVALLHFTLRKNMGHWTKRPILHNENEINFLRSIVSEYGGQVCKNHSRMYPYVVKNPNGTISPVIYAATEKIR